ncbi:M56 family metallopeptidase [Mucilaginibacter lacusdianchii]|uniref:M56 family metallopeptidase n=1 Tax=Mucilaginibacter lacusdianchii TaxID=2684211 RepID=UPI00131CC672|nr:M56 family metallopeptidase [Mucilaginibacter sp. JXJ CY 39]
MINWLHYLLEVNIYLTIAYGCYWLLFKKETFYATNRVYLLASTVMCFIIPLIQISILLPPGDATPQAVFIVSNNSVQLSATSTNVQHSFLTANNALGTIYSAGTVCLSTLFILKLCSLLKLILSGSPIKRDGYTLILLKYCPTPYSFLHYLFAEQSKSISDVVLEHELTHIRQKHTWDILFLEVVKIVCWFNPVVYLIQHNLKTLHEFAADRHTTRQDLSADEYVEYLINHAQYGSHNLLANQFSDYKLLKNRIIMLYQTPSGKLARLKYLVAAPVCAGLLCASTLAFSKTYGYLKIDANTASKAYTLAPSTMVSTGPDFKSIIKPTEIRPGILQAITSPPHTPTPTDSNLRLKIKDGDMTIYSSNISVKDKNATWKKYNAESLTKSDQENLNANHKLRIDVLTAAAESSNTKSAAANLNSAEAIESKIQSADTTFNSFYKQIGRTVRYPAVAREAGLGGRVTTLIKTDNNGMISDVYITKGVSTEINNEVTRAIKACQQKLPDANAYYSLPVSLALIDSNNNQLPFKGSENSSNTFSTVPTPQNVKQLSQVTVVGYIK